MMIRDLSGFRYLHFDFITRELIQHYKEVCIVKAGGAGYAGKSTQDLRTIQELPGHADASAIQIDAQVSMDWKRSANRSDGLMLSQLK